MPALRAIAAYVSSDGLWYFAEAGTPGSPVAVVDPLSGAVQLADFGWATPEMAEVLLGVRAAALSEAPIVRPPQQLDDGSIVVVLADVGLARPVVLESDGSERLRLEANESLELLDAGAGIAVMGSIDGSERDVFDLLTGARLGRSDGPVGMTRRWIVGDLLASAGRPSSMTGLLDLTTGRELPLPAGTLAAVSPDGAWLAVHDDGVVIVPRETPADARRLADGIPAAWYELEGGR